MLFSNKKTLLETGFLSLSLLVFYLFFQSYGIFGGDSGDLVSAAITGGFPHPPGYPLYTMLAVILVKLPFFTPAWRVALLSSFFSALAVSIFFILLKKLTKNFLVSLIASLILAFSYVFWLEAIVPEVFGLSSFFLILLLYLIILWLEKPAKNIFYWFIFIFGLSLSHHHTVVFLLPGIIYVLNKQKKFFKKLKISLIKSAVLFFLGLLPYLYLPWSFLTKPAIVWGQANTFTGFWQVLSRQIYGSTSSSPYANEQALLRFFQIPVYLATLNLNLLTVTLILAVLGAIYLWRKNRPVFSFLLSVFIFTGPFFAFYASFPLVNDFIFATFERFTLLSLPAVVIFSAFGIIQLVSWLTKFINKKFTIYFYLVFLLIPIQLLRFNLPKMQQLKNNYFADNLGKDILDTCEPNAILILGSDQPLFNTQYVYYGLKYRPDIKLTHFFQLQFPWYREILKKEYPEIIMPEESDQKEFIKKFLDANSANFPIYSNSQILSYGWREPLGLLYKYYPSSSRLPDKEQTFSKNIKLWQNYQDLTPLLSADNDHLSSRSLADIYFQARLRLGNLYLENGFWESALEEFNQALGIQTDLQTFLYKAVSLTKLNQCLEAENNFSQALELSENPEQTEEIEKLQELSLAKCQAKD